MDRDIRMREIGTVHFIDEEKRPRQLVGEIFVNFDSISQDVYVKVMVPKPDNFTPAKKFLMPFKAVTYIEWNVVET